MYDVVDRRNIEASSGDVCCQQDGIRGGFETLEIFQPLFLLQMRMQLECLEFQKLEKGCQPPDAVNG